MASHSTYDAALLDAQEKGFVEKDPSFDVEGFDAAQKLAILATLIFGRRVVPSQISREGITTINQLDIDYAAQCGYVINPLAIARKHEGDLLELRVCPVLIPLRDDLAAVHFQKNAVSIYHPERDEPETLLGM